jgi:hypothetical protein
MKSRILPPEEWARLGENLYADHLDARRGQFVVVEDEHGDIVGRMMFVLVPHAEDLWIAPEHRKRGVVGRHLVRAFHDYGQMAGVQAMIGGARSHDMHHAITAHLHGTPLKVGYYAIPVEGAS